MHLIEHARRALLNPRFESSIERIKVAKVRQGQAPYSKSPKPTKKRSTESSHGRRFLGLVGRPIMYIWAPVALGYRYVSRIFSKLWNKSWTAETCSYLLSLLALIGLVAILLVFQGKPIPEWPQMISINSVVSLFSLLIRTAVGFVLAEGISQSRWQWYRNARKLVDMDYFDSASRGPWGSFLMLCRLRPSRVYSIAAFGAFATIMAALTGFFSQQLLQFQDCKQRTGTSSVFLARTNNYTVASGSPMALEMPTEYGPLVAAATVGLVQPLEDFTTILTNGCDSGNCTFQLTDGAAFSTLAISHKCEDITRLLRQGNLTDNYHSMNYTAVGLDIGTAPESSSVLTASTSAIKYGGDDIYPLRTITLIFRTYLEDTNFTAVNCTLFPTINTYGAFIQNTKLEERLLDVVPLGIKHADEEIDDPLSSHMFRSPTGYTFRNGIKEPCIGLQNPMPGHVKLNSTKAVSEETSSILYYPPDCLWGMGYAAEGGLKAFLDSIFNDDLVAVQTSIVQGNMHLRSFWQTELDRSGSVWSTGKGKISFDTVDNSMKNMTHAITVHMRTHGEGGQAGYVKGDIWSTTTCVHVHWAWITFPVVTIAFTGVFLLLVVIDNWENDSERLWKSSILATLFCELDMSHNTSGGKAQMIKVAKSTSVSFESRRRPSTLIVRSNQA